MNIELEIEQESVFRRLFAYHLAHKSIFNALIASHPDPALFIKALNHYSEPASVGLLNSTFPDQHHTQYEEELQSFISLAEKHRKPPEVKMEFQTEA
jgi:hypothetical protein